MTWNNQMFQVLRLGKQEDLKDETYLKSPKYSEVIERKESVKDLGIMVDHQLDFRVQRQNALSMAWRKLGWIGRAFQPGLYLSSKLSGSHWSNHIWTIGPSWLHLCPLSATSWPQRGSRNL